MHFRKFVNIMLISQKLAYMLSLNLIQLIRTLDLASIPGDAQTCGVVISDIFKQSLPITI
jgi:hypothetical protein